MDDIAGFVSREVLLAPDIVARAATAVAQKPPQRWMLGQPRDVRRSYVTQVIDGTKGTLDDRQTRWMLQAPDAVRSSYVAKVLGHRVEAQVAWMLGSPESVRRSYVEQVLDAPAGAPRPEVVWMLRQPDDVRESYLQAVVLSGAR